MDKETFIEIQQCIEDRNKKRERYEKRLQRAKKLNMSYERYQEIVNRRYWAMDKAKEIGLRSHTCLMEHMDIDIKAYIYAQLIIDSLNEKDFEDRKYRLDRYLIARAWKAAGCENNKKFYLQIKYALEANKGDTISWFKDFCEGHKWLDNNNKLYNSSKYHYSRKARAAIGKLPYYCRWAAVHGLQDKYEEGKVIRIRDLNWDMVKEAQKGEYHAYKMGIVPSKALWGKHIPNDAIWKEYEYELSNIDYFSVNHSTVVELYDNNNYLTYLPAVKLSVLFGRDIQAAKRFISNFDSIISAGNFELPRGKYNKRAWAALANRYPNAIIEWLQVADKVEETLGRVPTDLDDLRQATIINPNMFLFIAGVRLTEDEYHDYERLWKQPHKDFVGIPAPGGSNGIRHNNLKLIQLNHNDKLQPFAGRLVNCCQHLHGAAHACAKSSWLEGNAAIWVAYENGIMVAQSFVWRSADGESVVLDSVESLSRRSSIAEIFTLAAKDILGRMSVKKVYIGDTNYGCSSMIVPDSKKTFKAPKCSFKLDYTDAEEVRLICKLKEE
jgi:hypothetical protein